MTTQAAEWPTGLRSIDIVKHATLGAARLGGRLAVQAFELPARLDPRPPYAERARATQPVHEAQVALSAVEHGRRRHDDELVAFGQLMAAKAINKLEDGNYSEAVSLETFDTVTQAGLDPSQPTLGMPEELLQYARPVS